MEDSGRSPQAGRATHERSQVTQSPPAVSVPNAVKYVETWEPMPFERPVGSTFEEWRENVCKTDLYMRGDTVLVWVNEGDLYCDGPFVKRLKLASAIEAQRVATENTGAVHESAVGNAETPNPDLGATQP